MQSTVFQFLCSPIHFIVASDDDAQGGISKLCDIPHHWWYKITSKHYEKANWIATFLPRHLCSPCTESGTAAREKQIKSGNPQVPVMQAEDDNCVCLCVADYLKEERKLRLEQQVKSVFS